MVYMLLELNLMRVDGNFAFRGRLKLKLMRVDGNFTFRGGLKLNLMRVDGNPPAKNVRVKSL